MNEVSYLASRRETERDEGCDRLNLESTLFSLRLIPAAQPLQPIGPVQHHDASVRIHDGQTDRRAAEECLAAAAAASAATPASVAAAASAGAQTTR